MEGPLELRPPTQIQGHMFTLGQDHVVAIYQREGIVYVADFMGDEGVVVHANTWFRFGSGNFAISHVLRRMALVSARPISPEMCARIEALHTASVDWVPPPVAELIAAVTSRVRRSRLGTSLARLLQQRRARSTRSTG